MTKHPIDWASWQGTTLVIKLGGELLAMPHPLRGLLADIVTMQRQGIRVVLVHGGGPQADALARELGHKPRKVNGRRITTDTDLAIAKYLYGGALNLDILGGLSALGARGMRVSGVDGGLLSARRRPPVMVRTEEGEELVDFGHVGDVEAVDPAILTLLLDAGTLPVVAPLAADAEGGILNINADTVAAALARALGANRLIMLTNVPGVLDEKGRVLARLNRREAERLIAAGVIRGGMIPKVSQALDALSQGVGSVQVLDGTAPESLLLSSLTPHGAGTVLTAAETAQEIAHG